jgi:predicted dehydrogenase
MADPLQILLVGAGWIGRRHVEALQRTGRAALAICEPHASRRMSMAQEFDISRTFVALDEALRHRWDGVVVATPAHTHADLGFALAERGLPVLMEKPVAASWEGVERWRRAAEANGAPVMMGYVYRCHPILETLREQLQRDRIGRPLQVVAQRGAHLPSRRPDYASGYYARLPHGGGIVHDILSHVYNAVEWLVGPLDRVAADAAHLALPHVDVDDTVHVLGRHGGVLASYCINQHQPAAEFSLQVNGSRGSVRGLFHADCWETADTPDAGWTRHHLPAVTAVDWFVRQVETFFDVITKRRPPPCSLAEGMVTLRAVLATLEAVRGHAGSIPVDYHAPLESV